MRAVALAAANPASDGVKVSELPAKNAVQQVRVLSTDSWVVWGPAAGPQDSDVSLFLERGATGNPRVRCSRETQGSDPATAGRPKIQAFLFANESTGYSFKGTRTAVLLLAAATELHIGK